VQVNSSARKRFIQAGTAFWAIGMGHLLVLGYDNLIGIVLSSVGAVLLVASNFFRRPKNEQ